MSGLTDGQNTMKYFTSKHLFFISLTSRSEKFPKPVKAQYKGMLNFSPAGRYSKPWVYGGAQENLSLFTASLCQSFLLTWFPLR